MAIDPITGAVIMGGASIASSLLAKPSESQTGATSGQQDFLQQQIQWYRKQSTDAIKQRMQQIMENQKLGGGALMDFAKSGLDPRMSNVRAGYGAALDTIGSGGLSAHRALTGRGAPDRSWMTPEALPAPDMSYLKDFEMPDYDTSQPETWKPSEEAMKASLSNLTSAPFLIGDDPASVNAREYASRLKEEGEIAAAANA